MTPHTPPLSSAPVTGDETRTDCDRNRARGIVALLRRCGSGVAALLGKPSTPFMRPKTAHVPILHAKVVLSQEGAKIWEEVAKLDCSVGKPAHHRSRRLVVRGP
jgi:hypothetical protein